jgi:hypothetical protein
MNQPSRRLLERMTRAADVRAGGASWDAVAERLNCRPATCSRWPALYPGVWRRLLREAQRRQEQEAACEARTVLRSLLRGSKDEKMRLAAAQEFRRSRRAARRARPIDPDEREKLAFLAVIRDYTDEELDQAIREELAANGAAGAAAGPPGAA